MVGTQPLLELKTRQWFCPGACIIKLITVVIYGFHNKLECLSLNTRLAGKAGQGQTV